MAPSLRRDVEGLETAEEQLHAATPLLDRINVTRKASGSIRRGADNIEKQYNAP